MAINNKTKLVKALLNNNNLEDDYDEGKFIADEIMKRMGSTGKFSDFAVLYRTNAQSNMIERTFAKSALPYRIYGGVRFGDRKEIKDVVAYLQLINNTSDRVRLKRIINEPRRKIGEVTLNAVESIADETGKSMFEVMREAYRHIALSRSAQVSEILCAPGNAGMARQAECVAIRETEVERLAAFAEEQGVELVYVPIGLEGFVFFAIYVVYTLWLLNK